MTTKTGPDIHMISQIDLSEESAYSLSCPILSQDFEQAHALNLLEEALLSWKEKLTISILSQEQRIRL